MLGVCQHIWRPLLFTWCCFMGVTVQPMIRLEGYELILGSSVDPQFGPVLLFGSGGQLVEVYRDRALGLPPLNTTLAHHLMEQTRIYRALRGVRGRGEVDLLALEVYWSASASLLSSSRASARWTSIRYSLHRSNFWLWTRAWSCTARR